jgi:hypothetical protein
MRVAMKSRNESAFAALAPVLLFVQCRRRHKLIRRLVDATSGKRGATICSRAGYTEGDLRLGQRVCLDLPLAQVT